MESVARPVMLVGGDAGAVEKNKMLCSIPLDSDNYITGFVQYC